MEQHNIDSRFKKGLENLDRQPSADAWARLQSQLNAPEVAPEPIAPQPEEKEEKRVLVWWHYAAAAVILLFVGIGFIKNATDFNGKTAPAVAVTQPKATQAVTGENSEPPEPVQPDLASEKMVAALEPETSTGVLPENNRPAAVKSETKKARVNAVESARLSAPETQLAQVAKPKKKRVLVDPEKPLIVENAGTQPEETLLASHTPATATKSDTRETKPAGLAGMAIEVIVKKDNSENLLAFQAPAETEEKDSKLKTIFKQARNLKNGDKVDLQALGVTPDSKLAMSTRNLQQKFTKVLDI